METPVPAPRISFVVPAFNERRTIGEVLERVDALLAAGRLRSTGGAYPKLRSVPAARAA